MQQQSPAVWNNEWLTHWPTDWQGYVLGDAIASKNWYNDVNHHLAILAASTSTRPIFWGKDIFEKVFLQKTSVRRGREDTCKEHSVYHANVMSFSSKARKWQISHLPRPMPIYTCFTDVFFVESGKRLQHQWTGCKAENVAITKL